MPPMAPPGQPARRAGEARAAPAADERREAEEARERYRRLFDDVPIGLFRVTPDGSLLEANRELLGMFRYPSFEAAMAQDPVAPYADPLDRERWQKLAREGGARGLELPARRFDGTEMWIRLSARAVTAGEDEVLFYEGAVEDVTVRREAEEEVRRSREEIRRLLSRLVAAQESERARIAADIHDDTIQVITAVGLRLEDVRRRLSLPEDLQALDRLQASVESAIGRLRHMLFELRPRALDEEGLGAALRPHLEELEGESGVACRLDDRLSHQPDPGLRVVLYRIALEALANVRKHAGARSVEVVLDRHEGGVLVRVIDDGKGFDPGGANHEPGHLGLTAIRERAEAAGGWLRVDSSPGRGTAVDLWLPERP